MVSTSEVSDDSKNEKNALNFALGEVIDISMVNSLYDALKILLNESNHIIIDAGAVKRLDTAAMQLILCWYKESQNRKISVTWKNINGVFTNSAKLLGMTTELQLPQ